MFLVVEIEPFGAWCALSRSDTAADSVRPTQPSQLRIIPF